jgi:hypothetical protein
MAREQELLPVPYYHIVFTLPHCLNALVDQHAKELYSTLFKAAWSVIQSFGYDPKHLGAKTGMVAILHTWGQQLWLHPHLHCIVPGGGITENGKWKAARGKDKYLFPKRALSSVFRARFMSMLRDQIDVDPSIAKQAFKTPWVVYAKRPFASPKTVVEYLGRYTHKIAISNHRLTHVDSQAVSFTYKDYKIGGKAKVMTINGVEFLRRFSLHILPSGFVRIRHYGFLASKNKAKELNLAKTALNQTSWEKLNISSQEIAAQKLGYRPMQCPHCKCMGLVVVECMIPMRGPPKPDPLKMINYE